MIKQFHVENYRALKSVTLELTPLHVLIGPNDSGKTSLLESIAALCHTVNTDIPACFGTNWKGLELLTNPDPPTVRLSAEFEVLNESIGYSLSFCFSEQDRSVAIQEELIRHIGRNLQLKSKMYQHTAVRNAAAGMATEHFLEARQVADSLSGVHYYRWNPRFLSLPVASDSSRRFQMEQSGFGLALCLDDILGYDRTRFTQLEDRFRAIFPDIQSIKLVREPAFKAPVGFEVPLLERADGKGLQFEFKHPNRLIPASRVSDGILLVLAYLTILYLPEPPRVILIEEPENGIHPNRLKVVLQILRDLIKEQDRTQVVLTTHSPYVVDLFKPDEVSLCRRQSDGTASVVSLSKSQAVRDQLDIFSLGEIWTSQGDEALAGKSKDEGISS